MLASAREDCSHFAGALFGQFGVACMKLQSTWLLRASPRTLNRGKVQNRMALPAAIAKTRRGSKASEPWKTNPTRRFDRSGLSSTSSRCNTISLSVRKFHTLRIPRAEPRDPANQV